MGLLLPVHGKVPVVDVGDDLRQGFLGAEHWSEIFLKVKKLPNDNFRIFLLLEILEQGFLYLSQREWVKFIIYVICMTQDPRK